jgi:hypothetical protein
MFGAAGASARLAPLVLRLGLLASLQSRKRVLRLGEIGLDL